MLRLSGEFGIKRQQNVADLAHILDLQATDRRLICRQLRRPPRAFFPLARFAGLEPPEKFIPEETPGSPEDWDK